jgi:predicted ATPase
MARRHKGSPGPYHRSLESDRCRIPADEANRFPYTLAAVRGLASLPLHPKVTFFVGENGSGKSTLMEAIAVGCRMNPEGGGRNFKFATRASHSSLDAHLRLAKTGALPGDTYFLRAESFYNVASEIERIDPMLLDAYGGRSLHEQSHGESFFALFQNRFRDHGLYLMDEPESALSPKRQIQFLALLHDYVKRGGQFVIATHSPILLAYPDACIYQLDAAGIREVAYADTEHFLVTRGFLANPKRSLDVLLADGPADTSDDSA